MRDSQSSLQSRKKKGMIKMAEKKMTKREYFAQIREVVIDNPELVAFIDHEVELISKKNSSATPSKTQIENEGIMEKIVIALEKIGNPVTISELQNADSEMATYSNQKLSALLKKLVDSGKVVKTTDKKKSLFSIA